MGAMRERRHCSGLSSEAEKLVGVLVGKCLHETMNFQPEYSRSHVSSHSLKVMFPPPSSLTLPISSVSLSSSHQGAQSTLTLRFTPHVPLFTTTENCNTSKCFCLFLYSNSLKVLLMLIKPPKLLHTSVTVS